MNRSWRNSFGKINLNQGEDFIHTINRQKTKLYGGGKVIRKFPYSFRNMFAILSDADCNDKEKFEGTHKFMNTLAYCNKMGQGVGLDIGDTFFMGQVGKVYKTKPWEKEWYYWDCKTRREIAAEYIRKYIKVGWIDIPHTFFNYEDKNAFSREQAIAVVKEWRRIDYKPIAWVDHADCPWNIMEFPGADPNSEFYCADIARQAGIKVFWVPLTIMPQDIKIKTLRGNLGFDTCLITRKLPDDRNIWGLLRSYAGGQTNNTWLGKCINRALFGDQLSNGKPANLDTYIIISTHLGYGDSDGLWDNQRYTIENNIYELNGGKWFNDETIQAFRDLKMKQNDGEILVTRSSRLIKYNLAHDMLTKYANTADGFTKVKSQAGEKIIISKIHDDCFGEYVPDVEDLRGITFYCENPQTAQIWIGDTKIDSSEIQMNDKDHTGSKSIGIKWYKQDTTDYSERLS